MNRVSVAMVGVGFAVLSMAAQAVPSGDGSTQALIERMKSAAASLTFSGTFVHQQDSVLQTSRITQSADGRQVVTRLQALEGHREEMIRTPSEIRTYMPDSQLVKLDQTVYRRPVFPAMFVASPALVLRNYDVTVGNSMRIANVDAQEVFFKPRHDQRWSMRVWIDKRTSLVVRCQKFDADQRAIEQLTFTELNFSAKPTSSGMQTASLASAKDWRVQDATMTAVNGVSLKYKPETLKGFELIGVYQRNAVAGSLAPFETRRYVLTDGIALVSVFVQPKTAGGPLVDKARRNGGRSALSRELPDAWLTVIGDVPPQVLGQFAQTIEWK